MLHYITFLPYINACHLNCLHIKFVWTWYSFLIIVEVYYATRTPKTVSCSHVWLRQKMLHYISFLPYNNACHLNCLHINFVWSWFSFLIIVEVYYATRTPKTVSCSHIWLRQNMLHYISFLPYVNACHMNCLHINFVWTWISFLIIVEVYYATRTPKTASW